MINELPAKSQVIIINQYIKAFRAPDIPCASCGECCYRCAHANAYQGNRDITQLKAMYGWDDKKGFAGEKGCTLPIGERADICVAFYCGKIHTSPFGKEAQKFAGIFFEEQRKSNKL